MSKTEMIMDTIKWINDTFVPKGLKPIEDLPIAVPGLGNACVIARVLQTNPKWENANVSTSSVNLGTEYGYSEDDFYIDIPEYIREFIMEFDRGNYPELIDIKEIDQLDTSDPQTERILKSYYTWLEGKESYV